VVKLRPTVSRPVCLGIELSFMALKQIVIAVGDLWSSCCGVLSITRGRVCNLLI
jgi:hypothetical protein